LPIIQGRNRKMKVKHFFGYLWCFFFLHDEYTQGSGDAKCKRCNAHDVNRMDRWYRAGYVVRLKSYLKSRVKWKN